ncbi:NAD-binding protein [Persephonella sp.]
MTLQIDKKILLFGVGIFGRELLKELLKKWYVIAVDYDEQVIEELEEDFTNEERLILIHGDASSILTWKKIDLSNVINIISTISDPDVSLEICRIGREVFNLKINIVVLLFEKEKEEEFENYDINIVKPTELTTKIVLSKIERNYAIATNIGLGKGEIVEAKILARSHLVDRKLKFLKPTRWRIAAIYRDGELILPSGDERIKVGDKVIIIGDPKVLENLVNILLKGIPQFPLQFGMDVAVPFNSETKISFEEGVYLKKNSKAHKILIFPIKNHDIRNDFEYIKSKVKNFEIKENLHSYMDLFFIENNIGVIVYPFVKEPFFKGRTLKKIFQITKKPVLISRGNFPYSEITISLNCPDPAFNLEIGIELSRLMKLPFEVIYVTMPQELRGSEEEEKLKERNEIVSDFEQIYKTNIKYNVLEGNPVKETVKYMSDMEKSKNLFVTTYDKGDEISFFKPHVQFHITKKIKNSVLLLPLEEIYG